jgi:hypothetical protein
VRGEELLSIDELINSEISLMFLSGNVSMHMGHSIISIPDKNWDTNVEQLYCNKYHC